MYSLLKKREAKHLSDHNHKGVKFSEQKQGRPTCKMQAFCKVMPTSIHSLIRLKRRRKKP